MRRGADASNGKPGTEEVEITGEIPMKIVRHKAAIAEWRVSGKCACAPPICASESM